MIASVSVFLDFNLPNATTWFYFSFLLAVALFFKFGRLLSMRNLDVLTLFLLVPGLLVIQGTRTRPTVPEEDPATAIAGMIGHGGGAAGGLGYQILAAAEQGHRKVNQDGERSRRLWLAYLSLLAGSGYFLLRCLIDLALVHRPALAPNLAFGGSAWLAGTLFVCLLAVAFRPPDRSSPAGLLPETGAEAGPTRPVGPESAPLALARQSFFARYWWLVRAFAAVCHLLVVMGLVLIAWLHFRDPAGGMAAATFYLMLPYTGLFVGQAHHVWPSALVIASILSYRWPTLAGAFLGLAAGTAYYPALVVPLWLGFYWGRGAGRFAIAFLLVGGLALSGIGLTLWWQGELDAAWREVWNLAAWQPWKTPAPHSHGFWIGIHWAYRIPIFLAFMAFVLLTAIWPRPKNLGHVVSLSAAVFIGVQFWYADEGGVYILWYLPLLLLMVFRPRLEDHRPRPIDPDHDWLRRLARRVRSLPARLLRGRDSVPSRPL